MNRSTLPTREERCTASVPFGAVVLLILALLTSASVSSNRVLADASATLSPTPFGGGHGQISYNKYLGGPFGQLTVVDVLSGKAHDIPNTQEAENHYTWSPDGQTIAFMHGATGPIILDDMATDQQTKVPDPPNTQNLAWSRDGKTFAFDLLGGPRQIYTMSVDGSNPRNISNHDYVDANSTLYGDDYLPTWSPDGKQIAYMQYDTDPEDPSHVHSQIYVMNADGSNQHKLSQQLPGNSYMDANPAWSPDGKQIAFDSDRAGFMHRQIYVMNSNGSDAKNLSNTPTDEAQPAWSPDGQHIVFVIVADTGNILYPIWIMNTDGSNRQPFPLNGPQANGGDPQWRP